MEKLQVYYCAECGTCVFSRSGEQEVRLMCPFCRVKQRFIRKEEEAADHGMDD